MVYTIQNGCNSCGSCEPKCPNGAIKSQPEEEGYWIDPTLCDSCKDWEVPRCIEDCGTGSLTPLTPKKGRYKSNLLPPATLNLFLNGKNSPFASSMVMWEACNILAQRQSLPWQTDTEGKLCYCRPVHRNRGEMRFRLAADPEAETLIPMSTHEGLAAVSNFDLRATCINLLFAAYAITVDSPWEEPFVLTDQHFEQYLGLDKRKDLSKLEKLILIKNLVHQSCQILVALDWPRQGKVPSFALDEHPIWHLVDTQYYFEENAQGGRHLIGLGFTIKAGLWAESFLNKREYRRQTAFYQYGTLPQSLLTGVMSNWQQHEGAIRLLLWFLFKLRLGGDQRVKVRTLLRIAYGEERLKEATTIRGAHKRLLKTFEGDLETMYYQGLKPLFDPDTYPPDIQPLWVKTAAIPDDVNDAVNFWIEDANRSLSLTDTAPRDKWPRLLNARLLGLEPSDDWQHTIRNRTAKRRRRLSPSQDLAPSKLLSGREIKIARQQKKISQRVLADRLGKSQSWIRDIEKGRFKLNIEDEAILRQVLELVDSSTPESAGFLS